MRRQLGVFFSRSVVFDRGALGSCGVLSARRVLVRPVRARGDGVPGGDVRGDGVRGHRRRDARGPARGLADETGSILPFAIFYGVLCLVVVLLAVSATSLYLERERLFAVADGAALAGAESYDLDSVHLVGGSPRPMLEPAEVRAAVVDYLGSAVTDGLDGLHVERATTEDGRSASVRISAVWHPPVVSALVPAGYRIEVTSSARSVFG